MPEWPQDGSATIFYDILPSEAWSGWAMLAEKGVLSENASQDHVSRPKINVNAEDTKVYWVHGKVQTDGYF